jgi:hypothetical protein
MQQPGYGKIQMRLWTEADFRALSLLERTVALYLLTGPQSNRLGYYLLSVADGRRP